MSKGGQDMSRRKCALALTVVFCIVLLFSFSCLIVHSKEHDGYTSPCAFCATLMQKIEDLLCVLKIVLVSGLLLRVYSMRRFALIDHCFVFLHTPVQLKTMLLN